MKRIKYKRSEETAVPSQSSKAHACELHNGNAFTNFCSTVHCLTPLCPECIEEHLENHKNRNIEHTVESIKSVQQKCYRKVKASIDNLNNKFENLQLKYLWDPAGAKEERLKVLRASKEKLILLINSYFEGLEETLKRNSKDLDFKLGGVHEEISRFRKILSELEFLKDKMLNAQAGKVLEYINAVCLLDAKNLGDEVISRVYKVLDVQDLKQITFYNNDKYLVNIKDSLEKYCGIIEEPAEEKRDSGKKPQVFISFNDPVGKMDANSSRSSSTTKMSVIDEFANFPNSHSPKETFSKRQIEKLERNILEKTKRHLTDRSSSPTSKIEDSFVTATNFFSATNRKQFLHFFDPINNTLHLFNLKNILEASLDSYLEKGPFKFECSNLEGSEALNSYGQSIMLPNGELYSFGGVNQKTKRKEREIYKYDYLKHSLERISMLATARSSHSICYLDGYVYVIGGFSQEKKFLSSVERFSVEDRHVQQVSDVKYASTSSFVCAFGERNLFKFGGIGESMKPLNKIERFDVFSNEWTVIDPVLDIPNYGKEEFTLSAFSAGAQVNSQEIFVFGGYKHNNVSSNESFLFQIKPPNKPGGKETYTIRAINKHLLPTKEGFYNQQAIIMDRKIFCLQNVTDHRNDNCFANKRRLLIFSGNQWQAVN